jgi:hypothetical protein
MESHSAMESQSCWWSSQVATLPCHTLYEALVGVSWACFKVSFTWEEAKLALFLSNSHSHNQVK